MYFARRDGRIKVGFSRQPIERVQQMKAELIAVLLGGRKLERQVHSILWRSHAEGEWFYDDPNVRRFIEANCAVGLKDSLSRRHITVAARVSLSVYRQLDGLAAEQRRSISFVCTEIIEKSFTHVCKREGLT